MAKKKTETVQVQKKNTCPPISPDKVSDYFKWWFAIVDDQNTVSPIALSYKAITDAILRNGKIEIIGENRRGELLHDSFPAAISTGPNPTAIIKIRSRKRELWPQRQITSSSYHVSKFWLVSQETGKKLLFDDLELSDLEGLNLRGFAHQNPGFKLYGKLDDKRWLNTDQHDNIVSMLELSEGYCFAIGETRGHRQFYILSAPAKKEDVIGYVVHPCYFSSPNSY